ncbi:GTPase IMAP family member 9-like [Erythrolamprus reginae]|uniref:GTPase IMAP family member 9-like n=1 Tax=Erythrolamprus reginae TaxID=121349 RepID=UPI00396C595C
MFWESTTQTCQKEETPLKGKKVAVVDTPGFSHRYCLYKDIVAEANKRVRFCSPGLHVILHGMSPFHFMAQQIKESFGHKAQDYTILLFTCKDDLGGRSLAKVIPSRHEHLKEYIAECRNRILAFDNKAEGEEREAQVAELMTMIDALVERNRNAPCYMMKVHKRL